MTATVEQTQSDLPEMIRRAASGEEILIVDDGKTVAKLIGVLEADRLGVDRKVWMEELKSLRARTKRGAAASSEHILQEIKADRD